MKLPKLDFNTTKDTWMGILLCFCSVIGIIFNVPSVTYFLTKNPRSKNASYFQRVYQIISTIDLLICLTLFPYIDAAFSTDRRGRLVSNGTVCSVWSILWTVLPEMSVFMVAFISVSRLALLVQPHKILKPALGRLVPLIYCTCITTFKVSLRLQGMTQTHYRAPSISCDNRVTFARMAHDYKPTPEEWSWDIGMKVLACIQGMAVLPITISCVMCVVYIYKPRKGVNETRASARHQAATVTVITITVVYVIFNLPVLGYFIFLARWTFSIDSGNATTADILKSSREYFNTEFLEFYVVPLFLVCFTSMNSVINPLVYYARMRPFTAFVDSKIMWMRRKNKVSSIV